MVEESREDPKLIVRCLFPHTHSFSVCGPTLGLPHRVCDRMVLLCVLEAVDKGQRAWVSDAVLVWNDGKEVVEACALTTEAEGTMWPV